MPDLTRRQGCLMASDAQVAHLIGVELDDLRENRDTWETMYGFPKRDPATRLTSRRAIERWCDRQIQTTVVTPQEPRENLNAFS